MTRYKGYRIKPIDSWEEYRGLGDTVHETLETWFYVFNKYDRQLQKFWTAKDARKYVRELIARKARRK